MPSSPARKIGSLGLVLLALLAAGTARAAIVREKVDYHADGALLSGMVIYDNVTEARRPGILVVHDWTGRGANVVARAEQLAGLGYVSFAADLYGRAQLAHDHEEAAKLAGPFMAGRRQRLRQRVRAGFDTMVKLAQVDPSRTAAIGMCFGGMAVLELARMGTAVDGVVSVHGLLHAGEGAAAGTPRAAVLALAGDSDPMVPAAQREAFAAELRAARVDWQLLLFGGAMHAFTVAGSNSPSRGILYDARADRRSWAAIAAFLAELWARP